MYLSDLFKRELMEGSKLLSYIKDVLKNRPTDWLNLTTHRLDVYDEKRAKTQFLEQLDTLFNSNNSEASALKELPTAYDYIRLGHPLSSLLEWTIAKLQDLKPENVISFSSQTIPVLAILRKNLLDHKNTQINYTGTVPNTFDTDVLKRVYGYQFELKHVENAAAVSEFDGSTIFISQQEDLSKVTLSNSIDFFITSLAQLGSVVFVNGTLNESYISDIQHFRRRETIAMTPANSLSALQSLVDTSPFENSTHNIETNKKKVLDSITGITGADTKPIVGSSGLSVQYAIMMGLIHDAQEKHPGKAIKFIVPPNCYGGTNDQARRVAACIENVEIVDLPVDGDNEMVQSIETILAKIASEDAVPYIIAWRLIDPIFL